MKDGNEPKGANNKMAPEQQEGEEFGTIKQPQVTKHNMRRRSDTPRGSEPETRAESQNRS
ncbi:MAG TPA: hypothetical protein VIC34_02130 [Croceibacterium sp.]|jgi:hypothetical protein